MENANRIRNHDPPCYGEDGWIRFNSRLGIEGAILDALESAEIYDEDNLARHWGNLGRDHDQHVPDSRLRDLDDEVEP